MASETNAIGLDDREDKDIWRAYKASLEAPLTHEVEKERIQDEQAARTHHAAVLAVPSYTAPRIIHPTNVPLMAKISEVPAMASRVPRPSDAFSGQLDTGAPTISSRSALNDTSGSYKTAKRKTMESVAETRGEDTENEIQVVDAYCESMERAANHLEESPTAPQFPYPAMEAILAGVAKGEETNEKLRGYVAEMDKLQKDLSLLLDLNAKLNSIKDDVTEMPQDLRDLLDELKKRGMDIWPSDNKAFSKEIKSDIKSMSGAHQDKAKSNLHIITSAKIQHLTATLSALWECIKDIVRRDDAAKRKFLTLPGH